MKNQIIAGDYVGWDVVFSFGKLYYMRGFKKVVVDKLSVARWETMDGTTKSSSWGSAIGAGVGGLLGGSMGALTGAMIGRGGGKTTYLVAIELNTGERSLLQIDDKSYNKLVTSLF